MRTVAHVSRTRSLACIAVLAGGALLLAPPAQARSAPWSAVPSPNPTSGNNLLAALSTVSADDVWAVGQEEDANGNSQALAEHWDGVAWNVVATPTVLASNLLGVAAVSADNVWAVGSFLNGRSVQQALIEHWNGTQWHRVANPATGPGTVLNAITVVNRRDIWAVGEFLADGITAQTLTEHWNGSAWSVVSSPDAGTRNNLLTGVAAVSGSDVWAVGHFFDDGQLSRTLTENWNGSAWTVVPSPSKAGVQAGLSAVASASGGRYLWAVGNSGARSLVERWDGTSWVVVPSPSRAGASVNLLSGVAIVNGSDALAVGQSQDSTTGAQSTVIEQWNGVDWSIVPSPDPGPTSELSGAAADPSSGQVWSVGLFGQPFGIQQTLTEFKP